MSGVVELPSEYEGWEEVDFPPETAGSVYLAVGGVRHCREAGNHSTNVTDVSRPRYFVPPSQDSRQ